MFAFHCNCCGAYNQCENFATEPATCSCGSNVRQRALIHLLSMELFGESIPLPVFPRVKAIRGMGMTDAEGYASILANKFDYTNTYYDRGPRFDFTERHPELTGYYDFILSADVLEHIAPPIERALEEVCALLQPGGFLGATIYCNAADEMREHFPGLHEFRIVRLGNSHVLVNRTSDGSLEVRENLIFHGGPGSTLEMREFGIGALEQKLLASGFASVHFLAEDIPAIGVVFDHDVSQPLIARKQPFTWSAAARAEIVRELLAVRREAESANAARGKLAVAAQSKWVKLGRRFGLGPALD